MSDRSQQLQHVDPIYKPCRLLVWLSDMVMRYTLHFICFPLFPDKDVVDIASSDEEGSCDKPVLRIPGMPSVDLSTLITAIQRLMLTNQESFVDMFRFRCKFLLSLPSSLFHII